jgi:hypothetical protein
MLSPAGSDDSHAVAALSGFVPLLVPGASLGKGSDARSVIIHSASLGGAWIANGTRNAVATSRSTSHTPSASSKRWLVVAYDDRHLKLVELNVTSSNGQLYVHAVCGKHLSSHKLSSSCDIGVEANMALDRMSAAPVVTSEGAIGYGVHLVTYSKDDSTMGERIPDDCEPVMGLCISSDGKLQPSAHSHLTCPREITSPSSSEGVNGYRWLSKELQASAKLAAPEGKQNANPMHAGSAIHGSCAERLQCMQCC